MRLISNISSIAGLVGFVASYFAKFDPTLIISMIVFIVSALILLTLELKNRPRKFTDTSSINKYMLSWISNPGRIVIFTRDMSWATAIQIEQKLLEKAKSNELVICMPQGNQLSQKLADSGADVIDYPNLGYIPQSRFTIVHYGRSDAKIAIGKAFQGYHLIEELGNGDHPLFYVAQDFINVLMKAKENGIQL